MANQPQQSAQVDTGKVFQVTVKPGIQRDGTSIDTSRYNDGEWVRFSREAGRPRKMGGMRNLAALAQGPIRGIATWSRAGINQVFLFSDHQYVQQINLDINGTGSAVQRREYTGISLKHTEDYVWQCDVMYDSAVGSDASLLIVHPGRNLINIDNSTTTWAYYAYLNANDDPASGIDPSFHALYDEFDYGKVSGGLVALSPFLVLYGSDGYVAWSNENEPRNFITGSAGRARITGSKIVKALPLRGGSNSPAALLWSLDSVFRMYYIGGTAIFKFDPLSSQSSVLSSSGIVEYDGKYYWAGVDRFLMYDGTVKELPNTTNQDFFFDGLNWAQRQKIWVSKVTRFGEIWWFFPKGEATECNHAIIYNVRLNCWYDTPIERTCGVSPQVYNHPIWVENVDNTVPKIWVHEEGWDKIDGETVTAIPSFFETCDFGFPTGSVSNESTIGVNRWTRIMRVEPDFRLTGPMTMQVVGQEFAQTPVKESTSFTFDATTGKIDAREQRREIRLRFSSNALGGTYDSGKILIHLDVGDVRS